MEVTMRSNPFDVQLIDDSSGQFSSGNPERPVLATTINSSTCNSQSSSTCNSQSSSTCNSDIGRRSSLTSALRIA